ncbi:fis family transcriptional regulator [Pseudomonas flexibilis]|nr:fis family transcriptional regulator [Pseudomonas flexibilis]
MVRLDGQSLGRLERIRALLLQNAGEWIAVLSAELLPLQRVRDFIYEWFFDFHTLPLDEARIRIALGRAYGMSRLRQRTDEQRGPWDDLLGESRAMSEIRRLITRFAPTDSPVMIRGESGTGKEVVARALHNLSRRAGEAFVAINCGAIPENLIQSELFGHEKGAFTGAHQRKVGRIEAADGGTLLLDEIGDLPLELQANLLRFLQEKHIERVGGSRPIAVNVRVLSATHIDLEQAIREGRFREDLYYRLNVLQIRMPPLRERLTDLPQLAAHFARLYSSETGRRPRSFSETAIQAMLDHPWAGNIRELANRVRRGLVLAEGRQIEAEDMGLAVSVDHRGSLHTLEYYRLQAERQALGEALRQHTNNLSEAARALGISRPTFYRLLHKHGLL